MGASRSAFDERGQQCNDAKQIRQEAQQSEARNGDALEDALTSRTWLLLVSVYLYKVCSYRCVVAASRRSRRVAAHFRLRPARKLVK